MKNFKEKRKSLKKKILKKSNTQETQVAKITNTTLEEQRKEILNKGKKFKYPVQYSKNRLVGNALIIALVILITGSGLLWYQLYQAQNTGEFIYRFTTVIPFPVANVDGENALYRDYLMEYRANMQIANAKKDEIESANNVKALSVLNKNKAMKNAIANAYAQKKAREMGISVSDKEIDEAFDAQRKTQNTELTESALYKIAADNYGLSPSEYRRMFIELPLLRRKVTAEIDKNAAKTRDEVVKYLNDNSNDFSKAAEQFGDKIEYNKPGKVRKTNIDGGRSKVASQLNVGEVSKPFISNAGDGYYIVKLIEKSDNEISYESIKIKFTEFNSQLEKLEKEGKVKKYIKVD
ncbi:MAG: SurA N-terminal domain-containing protein [Candidatus Nanogingivalaceae bacterium]|nr:SurA N-terminal domain-containing protein [Candidatus Nanogingivalaceae bacterium]